MKKLYSLIFMTLFLGYALSGQTVWNISDAAFNALATISASTTVNSLKIYAAADKTVIVDANPKTFGDLTFTHRMKTGGAGNFDVDNVTPLSRVLGFDVTGSCIVQVLCLSSSSTETRELIATAGSKTNEITRLAIPAGTTIENKEFFYGGGPTTIYLFSASSGINFYYIKVTSIPTAISDNRAEETIIFPNPAEGNVYVKTDKTSNVDIYNASGILVKQQKASPSLNSIDVSGLNPGVYYVKTANEKKAQKLIVK